MDQRKGHVNIGKNLHTDDVKFERFHIITDAALVLLDQHATVLS